MQEQRVMILTGCASGIGKCLSESLYREGHHLTLTDVNEKALQEVSRKNQWDPKRVVLQKLDVRKSEDWKAVIQTTLSRWNRIDVLFNVAGVIQPGFIHEIDLNAIDFHIDTNLKGTIIGTKLAAEQMVRQKQGHIINIASLAGVTPVRGLNLYSASKFGVRGFTLSVAEELKEHNVTVSVVCPDAVDTPMLTLQLDYPEACLTFSGSRALAVEEVGKVILNEALKKKKLEVIYPASRGWIAKLASVRPQLAGFLMSSLIRKGLKNQQQMKERH